MDLSGVWKFKLDPVKEGIQKRFFELTLEDEIYLPQTTSQAKKGKKSENREIGCLTDPYLYEGYAWYQKEILLETQQPEEYFHIFSMERTRNSKIWINGEFGGEFDSLCTSHIYDISPFIKKGKNIITVLIDNTEYKTRGGHMTSPDTQTNWNGILGNIKFESIPEIMIREMRTYPDRKNKELKIDLKLKIKAGAPNKYSIHFLLEENLFSKTEYRKTKRVSESIVRKSFQEEKQFEVVLNTENEEFVETIRIAMQEPVPEWDEYEPKILRLKAILMSGDNILTERETWVGFRDFTKQDLDLKINEKNIFLRGKHDGMIFPLTGAAPMDLEEWVRILFIAKEYGINHYRYHTCCPPLEAFHAADLLGIYMEPELPFWGTIAEEGEEYYNGEERDFLVQEGFRILSEYGNSPSFFALSMGNELWGSKSAINSIMKGFKDSDQRHMYTQGSNNHQFVPSILEQDDFFSGVRFSKYRLFRGSYAMCDAPLGHVQVERPGTCYHYDDVILPSNSEKDKKIKKGDLIQIQYGTGVKEVIAEEDEEVILPDVPVISHEIGQYETFPDFDEIEKYTGVLKAKNFEVFRERLEEKGLLAYWKAYFMASGKLAGECYRRELDSAMNSKYLSGFQLLDLQDFSGQGTALVGILNAFMENKGTVSKEEWLSFCNDQVLLPNFEKFVYHGGETFFCNIKLRTYAPESIPEGNCTFTLHTCMPGTLLKTDIVEKKELIKIKIPHGEIKEKGLIQIGNFSIELPEVDGPTCFMARFELSEKISRNYELWVYPEIKDAVMELKDEKILVTSSREEMIEGLETGKKVLFFPDEKTNNHSIEGTYATDFWCYPMFRSISESVNRAIPVGTMGLLIQNDHPALEGFISKYHSTPQWYSIVNASRSTILDETSIDPIVRTIDNFERNHNLGLIYECQCDKGDLLVCTASLREEEEGYFLKKSLYDYLISDKFVPQIKIEKAALEKIFS